MPPTPINLPPGYYRNGTPYSQRGRWVEGNHVRYHDGSVRPIGGWLRRQTDSGVDIPPLIVDPDLEAVRDAFSWKSLTNVNHTVFGSNLNLFHMNAGGVITNITYAGYLPSDKDSSIQAGYGQNPYGAGAYGTANNLIGQDPIPPARWYFDNFGEVLLTGSRLNGGVYELDLNTLTLSIVTNAPSTCQDLIVTEQRQVLVIGGEGQPRRVQSSDIENRNDWTPAIDNQSVDRTLAGTGKLLRCVNVLKQTLIIGEQDAHVVRYIGSPYVFAIDLVGENCGPLSAEAVSRTERFAVWWGPRNFWQYDGVLKPLPCDVIDFLADDVNFIQKGKVTSFTNALFNEVWWLYESISSTTGELDSYVIWNYLYNTWYTGKISRTTGLDRGVQAVPLMVDVGGNVFNHEQTNVLPADEGEVYIQSGTLDIANGRVNMMIRYIYPDVETLNGVTVTLIGKQFPSSPEYTYGPYSLFNPTPTRARGRSIKQKITFTAANTEWGVPRFDIVDVGAGER